MAEPRRKIRDGLEHGSRLGWLIGPIREQLGMLRTGRKVQVLKVVDTLSGEAILPGFSLPLEEIFGRLDQD